MPNPGTPIAQPLVASAARALARLAALGEPVPEQLIAEVETLAGTPLPVADLDALLERFLLIDLEAGDHGFRTATALGHRVEVAQAGWRSYLVRVRNPHGWESAFELAGGGTIISQPIADGMVARPHLPDRVEYASTIRDDWWYEVRIDGEARLSGIPQEYLVISIHSRDAGLRTAPVTFTAPRHPMTAHGDDYAKGTEWHRLQRRRAWAASAATVGIEIDAGPSREVEFEIRDADGRTCVAAISVRDAAGRVYPARGMRLAPDMHFHDHVYRGSGERIRIPQGRYRIGATRGPEYLPVEVEIEITDDAEPVVLALRRWVDPSAHGYYSGDPHLHGGGCSHYSLPTEGVAPETMIRHARGEGLWLSSILTWGPCYYFQKQFFTGVTISPPADLEQPAHQAALGVGWAPQPTDLDDESSIRYDLEISGFPSSHSGHLILLGLSDQDYPGTHALEDWPSWNLPVLRWARLQGAFTGFAHCGLGMDTGSAELPNFDPPRFASIGANEAIVDVPLDAADFLAGAEVGVVAELNTWYHLLNVGYRTIMVGETDYPCISDERPGAGRTYIQLGRAPRGPRALEEWLAGLRSGASYFGDGRSHVFDLSVDGDIAREQRREAPGPARITARVCALLPEQPPGMSVPGSRLPASAGYPQLESWNLEWARLDGSRNVAVELVVNGEVRARREIVADGSEHEVAFDTPLRESSWIALRILPSAHAQPVFVEVADRPIRASRRSAQWLHDCVDELWAVKNGFIRPRERAEARASYDAAKAVYLQRRDECGAGT